MTENDDLMTLTEYENVDLAQVSPADRPQATPTLPAVPHPSSSIVPPGMITMLVLVVIMISICMALR